MVKRFDVYLCEDHAKLRPCVILSPDEMNGVLPYVLMPPLTTNERLFPCRVGVRLKGKQGQVALDMMRTVLQSALKDKMGTLDNRSMSMVNRAISVSFGLS